MLEDIVELPINMDSVEWVTEKDFNIRDYSYKSFEDILAIMNEVKRGDLNDKKSNYSI